jgi:FtsP/CotA-like multicopper oxidase with cupredoxin domain/uncharacterized membrane protein
MDAHPPQHAPDSTMHDHTRGVPSTAAIGGHPIHPALVPLPIGLLVGALGADLGAWWTSDPFFARAALWLTAAGVGFGTLAAIPGLIDFLTVERARVHRIGWVHALGNGAVLLLAATSWMLRLGDPATAVLPWGLALSALTVGLLLVTGWTGGELAYRHMVGVTGHGGHGPAHAGDDEDTAIGEHPHDHDGPSRPAQPPSSAGSRETPAPSQEPGGHQGHAGMGGMAGMGGGPIDVAYRVTRPQLAAVALASVVLLAGALLFSASRVNLGLGARDVGGLVMPPGMIMTRDTPGQAMRDMAAVDPGAVSYRAPVDARGDQPLVARLEAGVKVYDLETSVIEWNILPYERVMAYAFNRQVPGPRITVTEGDRVRFNVTNRLPEATTVHWHGLVVPNAMDGPAEITQVPIPPGGSFSYQFTVRQAGTFFYHSHSEVDRQQALGLYGALIVQPKDPSRATQADQELLVQLQEWNEREGYTFPAMPMEGTLPNFFTINGKAYPATEIVHLQVGQRLLVRFIGSSSAFIHPMHIHGGPFEVVATDGVTLPESARYEKDTVNVGPGERYDVLWTAREPGKWLLHCHINHHVTNDNVEQQGGGGLMLILNVTS